MTMHKTFLPRDGIDKLDISREEQRRGYGIIEDYFEVSIQGLDEYIK